MARKIKRKAPRKTRAARKSWRDECEWLREGDKMVHQAPPYSCVGWRGTDWVVEKEDVPHLPPLRGTFRCFKKAQLHQEDRDDTATLYSRVLNKKVIIELEVSASALWTVGLDDNGYFNQQKKCRASRAKVISITELKTGRRLSRAVPYSRHGSGKVYEVGKEFVPDEFDESSKTCSHGVHFFMSREVAETYDFG